MKQISTGTACTYVLMMFLNEFFWVWVLFTDHVAAIRGYAIFQLVCFAFLCVFHMVRGYTTKTS